MIEGSGSRAGSGSGSIPLTSGSGSGRPNNMWIRIGNTAFFYFSGYFCPPGSGSAIWMWIRIQQLELMRFHADPDPKPWYNRKELTKIASGFCLDEVLDSVHLYTAENVGRTQLPHQVAAKLPRVLSRATLRKKYSYLPNSKVNWWAFKQCYGS